MEYITVSSAQPEVDLKSFETVIIMPLISGGISYILLDKRFVK